jgi:hypothetical protein
MLTTGPHGIGRLDGDDLDAVEPIGECSSPHAGAGAEVEQPDAGSGVEMPGHCVTPGDQALVGNVTVGLERCRVAAVVGDACHVFDSIASVPVRQPGRYKARPAVGQAGGGQAGPAMRTVLQQRGCEYIVLERRRVGAR